MRPLLQTVVALCLIITINAESESIESNKQLSQSKEPLIEDEDLDTQTRVERCTTCGGLNIKSANDVLASLKVLPGEFHSQQSYHGCSSESGCAGLKLKDGQIIERYGNLDALKAASAADVNNEYIFHAPSFGNEVLAGGIPSNGPYWWMSKDSPFKAGANFDKFSQSSSSSYSSSSGSGSGSGSLDLGANPFLNGQLGGLSGNKQSSSSSFEYSSSSNGNVDFGKNPFLNGGVQLGQAGLQGLGQAGVQGFGLSGAQGFGQGSAQGFEQNNAQGFAQSGSSFASGSSDNKFANTFVGSSPRPFGSGSNVNLIQNEQKNEFDYQQTQSGGFSNSGGVAIGASTGGDLQQTCSGVGYVCVLKSQCNNGVININGAAIPQASTKKQYCNLRSEICCRIETAAFGSTFNQGSGLFAQSGSSSGSYGQAASNSFGQSAGVGFNKGVTIDNTGASGSFGIGSTVAPTTSQFGGVYQGSSQSSFGSDSFSSGSESVGVYRPGAVGLKPGIPYLPPVDNANSGSNVVASTVFPRPTFTTPRPYTPVRPTYLPPSTAAPTYLPPIGEQSINRETVITPGPIYSDGSLILDESRTPRPRIPVGPVLTDIPAGCAAALKCTPIEYCTAEGVISNTTVALTRDQDAYRVPLTDCKDLATGRVGKCCRDPYYTDPWPVNQIGQWVPGVFGGNDGKYVPDSRISGNEPTKVTARPPVTGSVILPNFLPKPTPAYGKGSVGQNTIYGQVSGSGFKQGQGQIVTQGQGAIVSQGVGSAIRQGQGQLVTGGQGAIISQGVGQGILQGGGVGITTGQGQIVKQGQGQYVTQGQGQIITQGQGEVLTGIKQGQGQYVTQGQGQIIKQGQGEILTGIKQGQGQYVTQGQGQIIKQGQGEILTGIKQGQGAYVTQGQGAYVTQGQGQAVTQGQGQIITQGQGEILTGIKQGQGAYVTQGQGQAITQGQGAYVTQGQGQAITQGQGSYVQQGQGAIISQGFGQGIRQGQGFKVTQTENEYSESVQRVFLQPYTVGAQCGLLRGQKPYGNRNDLEVDFAEIPWQAMILLQTNKSLLCGGIITRPDVVITSAACVDGLEAKNVLIKGGEWKLGIDEEPLPFQIVQVKTILRHPFYKPGSFHYDAAILVLAEDLRFANNIYPICLPGAQETLDAFYNGAGECIVTGWGKQVLQSHLLGSIMHSLNVSLITPGECQNKISQDYTDLLQYYDEDSCVCGQPTNPLNNICKVDIGSALACTTGDGQFTLRGVYSWDTGCNLIGNQIGIFYKFDLEWYEWAIGLIESVRFAQFGKGSYLVGGKGTIKVGTSGTFNQFNKGVFEGAKGTIKVGGQQLGFGTQGQFGQFTTGLESSRLNLVNQVKAPIITYTEPKIVTYTTKPKIYTYTTKPEIITYTTKPEIVTYTTKPEIVTFTTKPEIVTFTTKPEYFTYTTKPKVVTYTTKPKIVTYTTKPQYITYETSGSGTNPQYAVPGVSFKPSFSDIVVDHVHNPQCKCLEGKK